MHALRMIFTRFFIWVLLPLSVIVIVGWLHFRKCLPAEGTLKLAGLSQEVTVVRDKDGVPHIFAKSDRDAFFTMGYVHAQDRMWQLELLRRTGQGRLGESFDYYYQGSDFRILTFGLYRAGKDAWEPLDAETCAAFEAETAGINAWLSEPGRVLPIEFSMYSIQPAHWTVYDSMVITKMAANSISMNFRYDIARVLLGHSLGKDGVEKRLPGYPEDGMTTVARLDKASGLEKGKIGDMDYSEILETYPWQMTRG